MDDEINNKFKELKEKGFIEFITFHPSYCYEEFMEGITVHTEREGEPTKNVQYKLKSGIFKHMCKRALGSAIGLDIGEIDKNNWNEVYKAYLAKIETEEEIDFRAAQKYVLIIDEINRGDISKIFGELITLLEKDKRLGAKNELTAKLPYSNDIFGVPPNLYIIGTMNTADRSIALLDVALRRRFGFIEMKPDFLILQEYIEKKKEKLQKRGVYEHLIDSKMALEQKINPRICEDRSIGRDKRIGHSFLFYVQTASKLMMVWQYEILPLLDEYCYGNYAKMNKILFDNEEDSNWIKSTEGIVGFNENIDELKYAFNLN